jgi:hypothetical protein
MHRPGASRQRRLRPEHASKISNTSPMAHLPEAILARSPCCHGNAAAVRPTTNALTVTIADESALAEAGPTLLVMLPEEGAQLSTSASLAPFTPVKIKLAIPDWPDFISSCVCANAISNALGVTETVTGALVDGLNVNPNSP